MLPLSVDARLAYVRAWSFRWLIFFSRVAVARAGQDFRSLTEGKSQPGGCRGWWRSMVLAIRKSGARNHWSILYVARFSPTVYMCSQRFLLLVCVTFGLVNCLGILTIDVKCLVAGIIQICIGFIVMAVEAPFCCMFIDYIPMIAAKVEERPLWNRAAVYCG